MNKEQFLAISLRNGLKVILTEDIGFGDEDVEVEEELTLKGAIWELIGVNHAKDLYIELGGGDLTNLFRTGDNWITTDRGYKPILHHLSDLTKPIEHNGEMFVPIKELCNLYGAKFDKPYQNNMCAGFIYGFAAHDVLNLKNIEKNEFWKIHKLIEWHFDIAGLIEKGEAIDVNTLPENPYK